MANFAKKWLRLAQNGQFWSFCRFFHLFPQNEAQIDLEWPISPDSQLFPSFTTKVSHFWRNLKNFHSWGDTSTNVLSFSTFFKSFYIWSTSKWPSMVNFANQSGLDSLKMANFVILQVFPSFLPKWGSDWLGMANFTWFTTFPIFYHQSISFLEKSQKFLFLRGGVGVHCHIFWSSSTFLNHFTLKQLKMTHNGEFCQNKWLRLAQNSQFWSFCRFFHLFPQNQAQIYLGMVNFTWFTTFPIFYHHSVSFLEKYQKSFIP